MMSLSLAYCLIIAAIILLLKFIKISGSPRSVLSTSSDFEITSGRVNFESNEDTSAIENDTIYESMVPQPGERY